MEDRANQRAKDAAIIDIDADPGDDVRACDRGRDPGEADILRT